MRITVGFTRPSDRLDAGIAACRELGMSCLCAPSLEPVKGSEETFAKVKEILHECLAYFVVFSGTSAIKVCVDRFGKDMLHAYLDQTNVACTGEKTAAYLEKTVGRMCDVVPLEYSGKGIAEELSDEVSGKLVLLLRSDLADNELEPLLKKAGAYVVDAPVYSLEPAELGESHEKLMEGIASGVVGAMVFANASCAKLLFSQMEERYGRKKTVEYLSDTFNVAMGEPTKKVIEGLGIPVDAIPERPTFEGMLRIVAEKLDD